MPIRKKTRYDQRDLVRDVSADFDPVLLDLADPEDYGLVLAALHNYAGELDHDADNEDAAERFEGRPTPSDEGERMRGLASRLRAIVDDIERQLDANSAARRSAGT